MRTAWTTNRDGIKNLYEMKLKGFLLVLSIWKCVLLRCSSQIDISKDFYFKISFISNVKFIRFMPKFQQNLRKNSIRRQSRNMYSTSAKSYKLMKDCLTTTYKTSDDNIIDKINQESQEIISSKCFKLKNKKIP